MARKRLDPDEVAKMFGATHVEKLNLTGDPVEDTVRRAHAYMKAKHGRGEPEDPSIETAKRKPK